MGLELMILPRLLMSELVDPMLGHHLKHGLMVLKYMSKFSLDDFNSILISSPAWHSLLVLLIPPPQQGSQFKFGECAMWVPNPQFSQQKAQHVRLEEEQSRIAHNHSLAQSSGTPRQRS